MNNRRAPQSYVTFDRSDLTVIRYDVKKYPILEWFSKLLGCDDLQLLHKKRPALKANNLAQEATIVRNFCEDNIGGLQEILSVFMHDNIAPVFGDIKGWQLVPTIRFHWHVADPPPYIVAEQRDIEQLSRGQFLGKYYFGENHRWGIFHRDGDYGVPKDMLNLWVPVTSVWGANSLWIGGCDQDGKDAQPIALDYGQALIFDGVNRWHGSVWNTSGATRVSFDLRFQPVG